MAVATNGHTKTAVPTPANSTSGWSGDLTLHSVSYAGLWAGQAKLSLEEFVPRAAQLGYQGVMLVGKRPHLSLLDYDAERRKRLRDLVGANNLTVSCIAGYTDFTAGAERAEIPNAEMQAVHVMELARAARDLGAPSVRIFTSYERLDILNHAAAWQRTVAAIKDAARRAADCGVMLCVQNHHDVALHHESLLALLEEIDEPNCKAAFDAWAPALHGMSGEALREAVLHTAPHMVHTTVADYTRRPRYRYLPGLTNYAREDDEAQAVPMGEGFIDYRTFFGALRDAGFSGSIAYEMCSPIRGGGSLENLDRYSRRFVEYMQAFAAGTMGTAGTAGTAGSASVSRERRRASTA
jgi:sugar phosphate isomerase/epimerase